MTEKIITKKREIKQNLTGWNKSQFYTEERRLWNLEFNIFVSKIQAKRIIRKLAKHYKVPVPETKFNARRKPDSGLHQNRKDGIPVNIIKVSNKPAVAVLCHEFMHSLAIQRGMKGSHTHKYFELMAEIINYAHKRNYWLGDEFRHYLSINQVNAANDGNFAELKKDCSETELSSIQESETLTPQITENQTGVTTKVMSFGIRSKPEKTCWYCGAPTGNSKKEACNEHTKKTIFDVLLYDSIREQRRITRELQNEKQTQALELLRYILGPI
jgi:hypothetical protein